MRLVHAALAASLTTISLGASAEPLAPAPAGTAAGGSVTISGPTGTTTVTVQTQPAPAAAPASVPVAPAVTAPPPTAPPPPPPPPPSPPPAKRRSVELFLGIGAGNAVCDDKKPESDCPVDKAGGAISLGGAWRFHGHWAVGLELAGFSYDVRETWRGQLQDPATDVKFSSSYLAPFVRWYWFERGITDGYLQAGLGVGSVKAEASNAGGKYEADFSGVVVPLAIGAEWHLGSLVRLGPQGSLFLHRSTRVCETTNGAETCRDAAKGDGVLGWRFLLVNLTFMLG